MWLDGGTFLGIRTSTLGAVAAVLVVAAICDGVLRRLVRRRVVRDEAAAAGATPSRREWLHWFHRGLKEAIRPLSVLIWLTAGHAAASLLLEDLARLGVTPGVASAVGWIAGAGRVATLAWLMARLGRVVDAYCVAYAAKSAGTWDDALLPVAGKAVRILLPLLALILGVPALPVPEGLGVVVRNGLSLVLIGTVAFLVYQLVVAAEALILTRYRIDVGDNLRARMVYTQVTVLKKVALVIIGVFTLASMLMVFDPVRQLGTSILASAGIAGIIVGFAAQRSIATLLAGLQIAVTQPIRIDDVVIVENEWGRIEDITLTYVVVRIWDQRRLVLPITYFIEKPFQNWTRTSSEILGTVFLHVDYRAPLDALRKELDRILAESPHWDGRVKVLQVTDAKPHTLEVRALASAADASRAWDLRCEVREKLIRFLQQHYPDSLPRIRAELQSVPQAAAVQAGHDAGPHAG
ncbi:MAG TPA: mechanosensitive ion channel domain-containing protein [Thermodesulfobacteriota bacterium]